MAEGLNQPSRVEEDGPMGCKLLWCGSKEATRGQLRVPQEQASANSVPAAAVIRRMRALSGIIGLKGLGLKGAQAALQAGGQRPGLNPGSPPGLRGWRCRGACGTRHVAVKCIDMTQNADRGGSMQAAYGR